MPLSWHATLRDPVKNVEPGAQGTWAKADVGRKGKQRGSWSEEGHLNKKLNLDGSYGCMQDKGTILDMFKNDGTDDIVFFKDSAQAECLLSSTK